MSTDKLLNALPDWPILALGGAAALALLLTLAALLRRKGRSKLSRRLTIASTVLGMAWSAQGMWDTAVHRYDQTTMVASVLFVVFEVMMAARMLKAHEYRADFARRARHVRAVWVIASIMAFVVAAGEGWEQAPGRLAIPLLVAYGWYTDLTADDDPADKPRTTWRWTLTEALILIGAKERGARDGRAIDRDRLRSRMTRLAFRMEHGSRTLNDLFNRRTRLARLKTFADDDDIAEVRARLSRTRVDLLIAPREPKPQPKLKAPVPKVPAVEERLPQGTHERVGRFLKRDELKQDAIAVHRKSVTSERPNGMTASELAALYAPALGIRTAENFAAESRRSLNGNVPELSR